MPKHLTDIEAKAQAEAGTGTFGAALSATFVSQKSAALQTIGNGGDPNSITTQDVKLLVTASRPNPDKQIEQHFVGYSFFSGNPAETVGTLQGGSCETVVYANGTADWGTALGFEGIGRADGNVAGRKIFEVVGNQGTAVLHGLINVDLLVALRAAGPKPDGGTGTVTESRSLDIHEPTVGTKRRSLYGVGVHRFRKGVAANNIEVSSAADVLQWSFSEAVLKGYASDGTSVRVTIDTADTPANARYSSALFGSGKHVAYTNSGTETFSVAADGATTAQRLTLSGSTDGLPAATAELRGEMRLVKGNGTTTADSLHVCMISATGTYSWKQIAAG